MSSVRGELNLIMVGIGSPVLPEKDLQFNDPNTKMWTNLLQNILLKERKEWTFSVTQQNYTRESPCLWLYILHVLNTTVDFFV